MSIQFPDVADPGLYKEDKLFTCIAKALGDESLAPDVRQVIAALREGHFLLHGVRREKDAHAVMREGVLPLTPESRLGTSVSFWNAGSETFGGIEAGFTSRDTAFFDYAHSWGCPPDESRMTMAVTTEECLREIDPNFSTEGREYIEVPFAVPREACQVLRTCSVGGTIEWRTRVVQLAMFRVLQDITCHHLFGPGELLERVEHMQEKICKIA